MAKYLKSSESSQVFALIPPISVSIDSYISVLDLLRRFILQIAFSFGQPQLTNQNAGSAQRETGNLRKQTSAVNQK